MMFCLQLDYTEYIVSDIILEFLKSVTYILFFPPIVLLLLLTGILTLLCYYIHILRQISVFLERV